MAPSYDDLRVRLLQVRHRPSVIREERESFLERCRLRHDQMIVTDVLSDSLDRSLLDGVDAVMIGGAGAYSVTETFAWTAPLADLCRACAERRLPLFGSCWGHQFVARTFGGIVIHDPKRDEMGTHSVDLTADGQRDTLFGTLPPRFGAQMGHQDRVSVLPEEAVELARNDRNPYQAFRLKDLPIYGTQFHSELNEETERQRLVTYRDHYPEMADEKVFQRTLAALRPTPEADDLLRRFLLLYAVEDGPAKLDADLRGADSADSPGSVSA